MAKKLRNRRGETQTNVIMWLGVLMAVVIVTLWAVKNLQPRHLDLETVNHDLEDIQGHVNSACSSSYYFAKWNPQTMNGNLTINGSQICILNSFSKCRMSMCEIGLNKTIGLYNITYIVIEKNETFEVYSE